MGTKASVAVRVGGCSGKIAALAAVVWAFGATAHAETLKEALSAAYKFNPRLDAARASLRATDEEVPRALSGYRPTVSGSADTNYRAMTTDTGAARTSRESNPHGYTVGLVQPLFRGFRVVNTVAEAEATVRSGRETLRLTLLLEAVTAYMDVVRDTAIVRLRENNGAGGHPAPRRPPPAK